ncbi:aspartate--tRNA ligase [Mucisphaera calidilacus]|uniref:Aspartate--tRNA(Asp/Asn) ligase n=1 Tax=Mucisphaera calidilacus TaxID=2527982 RepID=A0A518BWM7_9BACT|nr:Aspartate--tRNA ligase [Mucisphaera calidilacus]
MSLRTHTCGALRADHVDQTVSLCGWVNSYRDHGGVIFIDLRDREGITQVVFHPENADAHATGDRLRNEDVVRITGTCLRREEGMANPKLVTGEIEVDARQVEILNKADTPPFTPDDAARTGEETRLRYRFIDMRRPAMQNILRTRHRVAKLMRDYFDENGFYEVETPFLCRSTPEGARDFLVPSRLQPGEFYALPQSPQLFKQILMSGGIDKYFQIVRCFRDEDPRADRQAEFTQLDVEMSFIDQEDVMNTHEGLMRRIWKEVLDVDVPEIRRMTYAEAMNRYGSDRPDLRFDLELIDVTDIAKGTDFKVFTASIEAGGIVKAIRVPGGAKLSRKETDTLAEWVKQFGAGGLPVSKRENGAWSTGIAKFIEPVGDALAERLGAQDGDLVCFGVSNKPAVVHRVLGELRIRLAHDLGMIRDDQWEWLWVIDFPLVEWDDDRKRWHSLHHPFTSPNPEDMDKLESDTANVRSWAYDLVLNGSELGGGSVRIHDTETQKRVFKVLGIDEEEARAKFGFLLDALRFGAPPHGGIAFGLDRIVMHLCGTTNIRDVIAFPKTQNGADLLTEAPSEVDLEQLKELHLRVNLPQPAATPTPTA